MPRVINSLGWAITLLFILFDIPLIADSNEPRHRKDIYE